MLIENRFIMKKRIELFISIGVLTFSVTDSPEANAEENTTPKQSY